MRQNILCGLSCDVVAWLVLPSWLRKAFVNETLVDWWLWVFSQLIECHLRTVWKSFVELSLKICHYLKWVWSKLFVCCWLLCGGQGGDHYHWVLLALGVSEVSLLLSFFFLVFKKKTTTQMKKSLFIISAVAIFSHLLLPKLLLFPVETLCIQNQVLGHDFAL